MVQWAVKNEEELYSPLLPHGTDDDVDRDDDQLNNLTTAAAAQAVGHLAKPRPPRRASATKRRQRKLRRIRSHLKSQGSISTRGDGSASSVASEDTHKTDNLPPTLATDEGDSDSERSDYGDGSINKSDAPSQNVTPGAVAKSAAVALVTCGGIAAYLASFAYVAAAAASVTAMAALGIAGGVCALSAPFVIVNEWRISKLPALRRHVDALQQQTERLQNTVDFLAGEEEDLREEANYLEETNERLKEVVKGKNAGNVDELVELVHHNQHVLFRMKENLRQIVLQDVVRLVLQCDLNQDGQFSKMEADLLETRLSYSLEIYGIVFDNEKFHRAVGLSPSIFGVMRIVKRLLPDENDRVSSFYDRASSVLDDMGSDDDDDTDVKEEEEEDDVYDVFYVPVEEELNKGCTESLRLVMAYQEERGERPTLMSLRSSARMGVHSLRCMSTKSCSGEI